MPYKLSPRRFDLCERHPVSKKRFESAAEILDSIGADAGGDGGKGDEDEEKSRAI